MKRSEDEEENNVSPLRGLSYSVWYCSCPPYVSMEVEHKRRLVAL